jgi:hypothetical protein
MDAGQVVAELPAGGDLQDVAVSADGREAWTAHAGHVEIRSLAGDGTIRTVDAGGQSVDPLYYLHGHLHRSLGPAKRRTTESRTAITDDAGALAHPLVTLCPVLAPDAAPPARAKVGGATAIALGDLADFHRFVWNGKPVSALEWRYTDAAAFESRTPGRTVVDAYPPPTDIRTRITNLWTAHGQALTDVAEKLQVPAELLLAILGREARAEDNPSPRAIRLEPLPAQDRSRLTTGLALAYDKVTGTHGTVSGYKLAGDGRTAELDLTIANARAWGVNSLRASRRSVLWNDERLAIRANDGGDAANTTFHLTIDAPKAAATEAWVLDGYSTVVPAGAWPGAAAVKTGEALTWEQLAGAATMLRGLHISPGLFQTIIATAKEQLAVIRRMVPTVYADLHVTAPPDQPGDFLRQGWLVEPKQSILAGAAKLRAGYLRRPSTRFDLPPAGGAYNSGSLSRNRRSVWGVVVGDGYVERAAEAIRAASELFGGTPAPTPAPGVRFVR